MKEHSKRKHRSPERSASTNSKRTRTISDNSESISANQRIQRAKSIFRSDKDPYFPGDNEGKATLDLKAWKLRVKVLCSINDDEDVFRDAVQGLVKICFPQGVLQEIGVNVVEQHMREGHASRENISHMRDVFSAEMVHRLAWMLAEHLDSAQNVEVGISSIIVAVNRLHGHNLDREVLGDIISAFQQLQDTLSKENTEQLANGGGLSIPACSPDLDVPSYDEGEHESKTFPTTEGVSVLGDEIGANSADAHDLHSQLAAAAVTGVGMEEQMTNVKKAGKNRNEIDYEQHNPINNASFGIEDDNAPVQSKDRLEIQGKVSAKPTDKVSKTWRWDVNARIFSPDNIPAHFKKMSDLFAYHALPVVQDQLGQDTSKGRVRKEIEQILGRLSEDEHNQWEESYNKLRNGDAKMLDRVSADRQSHYDRILQMPEAISQTLSNVKKKPREKTGRKSKKVDTGDDEQEMEETFTNTGSNAVKVVGRTYPQNQVDIKEELYAGMSRPSGASRHATEAGSDDIAHNVSALRRLATEKTRSVQYDQIATSSPFGTPIVDLLWGQTVIQKNERGLIAQRLTCALDSYVSIKTMSFPHFGGEMKVLDKSENRKKLEKVIQHSWSCSNKELRCRLEEILIPWVAANPGCFPSVTASPIILAYIMPYVTPVMDVLCGPNTEVVRNKGTKSTGVEPTILQALHLRGISKKDRIGARNVPIEDEMDRAFKLRSDEVRRGFLERILRQIALVHRDKFPDLIKSDLVKNWERMTGLKW
ncbi:hypothetical protein K505DRAFT_374267 [Melanomma pulvis-pyrius CBS 109.77]|uniref:Uncharacterized protein n=1 Tax=Melanomma pulvis-pyrius CBS 109.77 TaxID=1314802 RepID=A0A6A6XET7_9PLEO|nr:hypothetical protein K505DRAFT_374267 [Melanomma pulvis-pyrius CBS 109.77]